MGEEGGGGGGEMVTERAHMQAASSEMLAGTGRERDGSGMDWTSAGWVSGARVGTAETRDLRGAMGRDLGSWFFFAIVFFFTFAWTAHVDCKGLAVQPLGFKFGKT